MPGQTAARPRLGAITSSWAVPSTTTTSAPSAPRARSLRSGTNPASRRRRTKSAMESLWFLLCTAAAAALLFSPASAERDVHFEDQRDVTFDLDKIMQEMAQPDMLQEEADLTEIFGDGVEVQQRIVSPPRQYDILRETDGSRPRVLTPRGRRPSFGPRSSPPISKYPVAFPVGRPTSDNLQAICLEGSRRPYYSKFYFPDSGFSQMKSMADAVNNAESWLSTCCKGNQTWGSEVTLCCATQAWEQFVESFCEQDTSVKHRWYDCCLLPGKNEKLDCFQNSAPNPNYEPTEVEAVVRPPSTVEFLFNPDTCQRTVMTQYSVRENRRRKEKKTFTSQKVDLHFPPGRPTEAAIDSLCAGQKLRPLYSVKCLPSVGYELLARQAKTINRIEKGFKHCCKKKRDVHICADEKWRDELDRFCSSKNGERVDYQCCSDSGASDRYDCFQNLSPDPHYNLTSATEEISINKVCDTHKMIKKMFPVGFPLKSFVSQCCPLSPQDQNSCFAQRLKEMSDSQCSTRKAPLPTVRRCCRMGPQESPQCLSKIVVDAIAKATNILQRKKKKSCPIF